MRNDLVAIPQERRREGDVCFGGALHQLDHLAGAAARFAGDVDIVGTGILKRKTHEFAAALNAVPVVQLIGHGSPLPISDTRLI
ncbi:hypothetical protein D9M72_549250 [compost metagenome]